MKIATLVGEPILVDELSLIKSSSVRVKMYCRDPSKSRCFVRIFFNRVGYEARFISEKYKDMITFPLSPPDGKDEFRGDEEEDGEASEEDDSDRKHKRSADQAQGAKKILLTLRGVPNVQVKGPGWLKQKENFRGCSPGHPAAGSSISRKLYCS
jgi:hypothetical protein